MYGWILCIFRFRVALTIKIINFIHQALYIKAFTIYVRTKCSGNIQSDFRERPPINSQVL